MLVTPEILEQYMQLATEQAANRKMQAQPLEVVNIPGTWLNIRTVEALVGWKKTKINEEVKASRFPPPDRHSPSCSRWLSDHIRAYLACRSAGRAWSPNQEPNPSAQSVQ
jgi:predicted DNA-binding transcriptional regulator AlpA